MAIIDVGLVAELTSVVTAVTQSVKSSRLVRRLDGEVLAALLGITAGLGWGVVTGSVRDDHGVRWDEVFRGVANGVLAGIGASALYNGQKNAPFKNVLPSRQEKQQAQETNDDRP